MFEGAYTAIVTPFTTDGDIDFDCYRKLLERQIENGVDGVLPVGTTGESPTLNMQEHEEVIAAAVDVCRGRIKVMAGTGGNSTAEALELTRHAMDAGADGTLQVTPYYNKPSQEGLYRHFSTVADLGLPVVLYNVPGRTSRAIDIDTIERLSHHEHIVAVKEAGGSVERVSQILDACEIEVLSGDDSLTFPMIGGWRHWCYQCGHERHTKTCFRDGTSRSLKAVGMKQQNCTAPSTRSSGICFLTPTRFRSKRHLP